MCSNTWPSALYSTQCEPWYTREGGRDGQRQFSQRRRTDQQSVGPKDREKREMLKGNTRGKLRCHVDLHNYAQTGTKRFLVFTGWNKENRINKDFEAICAVLTEVHKQTQTIVNIWKTPAEPVPAARCRRALHVFKLFMFLCLLISSTCSCKSQRSVLFCDDRKFIYSVKLYETLA